MRNNDRWNSIRIPIKIRNKKKWCSLSLLIFFNEMLVNALREKVDIKSIIDRRWGKYSTHGRPKLTKVDRFSPVYEQREPDLRDEGTSLLWNGDSGSSRYRARLF